MDHMGERIKMVLPVRAGSNLGREAAAGAEGRAETLRSGNRVPWAMERQAEGFSTGNLGGNAEALRVEK